MTAMFFILLSTTIGLALATLIVPGINAKNLFSFIIAAVVLGLINTFLRPVLWFFTAPLSVITFGVFALVINALMIMLAAALVPGFEIKGFGSAFLAALVMAVTGVAGIIAMSLLTGADINWYSYEYHSQPVR